MALALTLAGIAYLGWVLACWTAKAAAAALLQWSAAAHGELATGARWLVNSFGRAAFAFDLAGPFWMVASLWLVIRASRQRRSISWSWLLISGQALAAMLVSVWATLAQRQAAYSLGTPPGASAPPADWSPIPMGIAVVIWVGTLVWLVLDGMRLRRYGPAMADGLHTHAYRR